jgi:hypothetical protein
VEVQLEMTRWWPLGADRLEVRGVSGAVDQAKAGVAAAATFDGTSPQTAAETLRRLLW